MRRGRGYRWVTARPHVAWSPPSVGFGAPAGSQRNCSGPGRVTAACGGASRGVLRVGLGGSGASPMLTAAKHWPTGAGRLLVWMERRGGLRPLLFGSERLLSPPPPPHPIEELESCQCGAEGPSGPQPTLPSSAPAPGGHPFFSGRDSVFAQCPMSSLNTKWEDYHTQGQAPP